MSTQYILTPTWTSKTLDIYSKLSKLTDNRDKDEDLWKQAIDAIDLILDTTLEELDD